MTRAEIALLHFKKRFNCAQSLLSAFAVDLGMDRSMALKIGNAFGGGLGKTGDTCGAVTGALIIIGLKSGAIEVDDEASKDITYLNSRKFIEKFRNHNTSTLCRDLLGFDIGSTTDTNACEIAFAHCPQYIQSASEILEDLLPGLTNPAIENGLNAFDRKLSATNDYPLRASSITTLQVNVGYRCNLACSHCHVEASPARNEEMTSDTVNQIIAILKSHPLIQAIDITGGAPELNPNLKRLIQTAFVLDRKVIVRTNLAILTDPEISDLPEFWAKHNVKVVASFPSYSEDEFDRQRGKGTFKKALKSMKLLNEVGYGQTDSLLEIDIMVNPEKDTSTPDQEEIEKEFKYWLREVHGIVFNSLIVLGNMPIGRLGKTMSYEEKKRYLGMLEKQYNPMRLKKLMCRSIVSIAPDGKIYDCDFWQMMDLSVRNVSTNIENFDYQSLSKREIITLPYCLMCTAGSGTSFCGALIDDVKSEITNSKQ